MVAFIAINTYAIIKGSFEQFSVVSRNGITAIWMVRFFASLAQPQNSIPYEAMNQVQKQKLKSLGSLAIGEVSFKYLFAMSFQAAFFFFLFFSSHSVLLVHFVLIPCLFVVLAHARPIFFFCYQLFDSHQIYVSILFMCRICLGGLRFSFSLFAMRQYWHSRAKYDISAKNESIQTT